ncbi:hypothetical protein Lsan_1764 [Legionella santicrucis]|uniref:Peptidase C58 YopT-type domain-containing protein n=1 Tax=Legionella santicrucis TaxID=45074 RepID=A0A0W0Z0X4_9GAMM|nr:hypothetical protein [Legionella santicrucis]KTD62777.1 hypothetical protein Lsan_1764 [Legionella santicrucis]
MLSKFYNFFASSKKIIKEKFSNQSEVLAKYKLDINDENEPVGMCQAMTNTYLDLILNGENPTEYLKDDKKFLKKAIHEENLELEFKQKNGICDKEDESIHHVFYKNNIPHEDKTYDLRMLTSEKFKECLKNKEHLLITVELENNVGHEVYLGKLNSSKCRFFDANLNGGEIIKPCEELIPEAVEHLKSYKLKENSTFKMGIS